VHGDLYTTVAQVLPVLLLALMWDSAYLERLRAQRRPSRRDDPSGFWWTKARVRVYALTVASLVMGDLLLVVLVLAGLVPDAVGVRVVVVVGLVVTAGSLLARIWFDVLEATRPDASSPGGGPSTGGGSSG